MLRVLLPLAAAPAIVAPDRIVAWGERRAFENPGAGRLRSVTLPMARLEGLVGLWIAWRWSDARPGISPLFGTVGLPALLTPQAFLDVALNAAYENSTEIEPKPWVAPATRLLGLCYVLVAVRGWRADAGEEFRE